MDQPCLKHVLGHELEIDHIYYDHHDRRTKQDAGAHKGDKVAGGPFRFAAAAHKKQQCHLKAQGDERQPHFRHEERQQYNEDYRANAQCPPSPQGHYAMLGHSVLFASHLSILFVVQFLIKVFKHLGVYHKPTVALEYGVIHIREKQHVACPARRKQA